MEPVTEVELKQMISEVSTINKGEEVLKHLSEDEIKKYIEYIKKMNSLKDESELTNKAFFEDIEKGIDTSGLLSTGVRSNGETLILVKKAIPNSLDALIKELGVPKGIGIGIGSCKLN